MTTLDQAFIKAFSQQGAKSAVAEAPSIRTSPWPDAVPPPAASFVAPPGPVPARMAAPVLPVSFAPAVAPVVATAATVAPVAVAETSVSSSISSAFRDVLAALEHPPAAAAKSDAPVHVGSLFAERQLKTTESLVAAATLRSSRLQTASDSGLDLSGQLDAIVVATAELADASPASDVSPLPFSQPPTPIAPLSSFLSRTAEASADLPEPKASALPSEPAKTPMPTKPRAFKPARQVERFTWPKVCRRLIARSPGEFDRLADALLAVGAQGKKVLGIAGCRQGEGATTMLLCAARRLADRGVKLAILDADLARPRLAKRLGVQPELGWNETTGETDDTDASLERAAVEAAANGLTLAPIQELAAPTAWTSAGWARLAECLKTLRSHFEMTLVDLGPLEGIQHVGDSLHRTIASELDAVLLIRNQRITSNEQLSIAQKELSAAGVVLAGLIENFIAE